MVEDLTPFRAEFNGSLRLEGRPERLTAETGAIVLREVMEQTGILSWFLEHLKDPRRADLITHPFSELLRTSFLLLGQGWRDQDDADALRHDAVLRLSVSDRKGLSPLETRPPREDGAPPFKNPAVPDGLASQPTMSRFVRALSTVANRAVLRRGLIELAGRRVRALRGGHRPRYCRCIGLSARHPERQQRRHHTDHQAGGLRAHHPARSRGEKGDGSAPRPQSALLS
jgi:hypothetical protein